MANSKGEGPDSNSIVEQILKDILSKFMEDLFKKFKEKVKEVVMKAVISKMNEFEERFKKIQEELDETQWGNESAMRMKEELTLQAAEWITKSAKGGDIVREVVILAFQKNKDSNNSSFTHIEMVLGLFKDYLKDHSKAEIGSVENYEECTPEELFNKLSDMAQQVIDLKDPQI